MSTSGPFGRQNFVYIEGGTSVGKREKVDKATLLSLKGRVWLREKKDFYDAEYIA